MVKDEYYRRLARTNRLIVHARERVDQQKSRVLQLSGLPECGEAVRLLRALDRALRLMLQYRAMLIRRLMQWPS
jgi:hypothetical protein